ETFDHNTKQRLGGTNGEVKTVQVFDGFSLEPRFKAIVVPFSLVHCEETIHEMRYLSSSALHKAKAQLGKRVQDAAKHQVSQFQRIFVAVSQSAPKTVAARFVVPCQPPAAGNRSSVDRMHDDRN